MDLPWGIIGGEITSATVLSLLFGCTKHCDFLDFIGANVTWDSTSDLV